jgi:catechol 2,3-dioxygenase-like lactoylglutathione lyase family enzyme
MLKRVDRVQIAVADASAAEKVVTEVFGAELVDRDKAAPLAAKRSTMQAGASLIEILEPDGAGAVQDFVAKWGSGLFGTGFSVDDADAAAHQLTMSGVSFEQSAGQIYLDAGATFGMRTVISQHRERTPVGAIKWIYEVTNVVGDWKTAADRYARIFGLDAAKFSPIESKQFGYTGTLTLFDPPARLDRVELAQITDATLAMGRFHQRRGDSLYMFFVETDDVGALEQRLQARGSRFAAHNRDEAGLAELFIHPSAFLGVLIGVSRTEHAWTWSGDPARAKRAARERAVTPQPRT